MYYIINKFSDRVEYSSYSSDDIKGWLQEKIDDEGATVIGDYVVTQKINTRIETRIDF